LLVLKKGSKLIVDGVFIIEDRLILKGSNRKESWSREMAVESAKATVQRVLRRK